MPIVRVVMQSKLVYDWDINCQPEMTTSQIISSLPQQWKDLIN